MSDKNFDLSFQNYADYWFKDQLRKLKKHASIVFMKSNRVSKKIVEHDWEKEAQKIENSFKANRAIFNGASHHLPFDTLILIGELLGSKKHNPHIKKMLAHNVLKHNGQFYKLDDLEIQHKIRKYLRTHQFEELNFEISKAA